MWVGKERRGEIKGWGRDVKGKARGRHEDQSLRLRLTTCVCVRVCVFMCVSSVVPFNTAAPCFHSRQQQQEKKKQQEKKSSLIPPRHWLHLCTHLIPNICSCEALWTHLASKCPPCISLCFSFIIRLLVHYLWLSSLLFSVAAVGFPATWRSSYCFQMYFCPHSNIHFNMALASLTMLFINSQVKHLVASWYNVSFLWWGEDKNEVYWRSTTSLFKTMLWQLCVALYCKW